MNNLINWFLQLDIYTIIILVSIIGFMMGIVLLIEIDNRITDKQTKIREQIKKCGARHQKDYKYL